MNKSELEKLLNMDCSKKENREKIERFILTLKPVQKMKQKKDFVLDVATLEKIKNGLCCRYGYRSQGITEHFELKCDIKEDRPVRFCFYYVSILTADRSWIGNAYGNDLWELLAKMIIKIYEHIKYGG